uniref:Protein TPLATE isoform X1 n=1 Tax=Elaeis guineensis var. tenera TaxID=51953 RepID=A0A6I9RQM8_ELAGV|nr:protein TPLATE isoform X1 [Elaeis guineensis]
MDILIAQIQADLRSNDALRQSGALLQALQQSAAGRDVSAVAKSVCEEIIASPASAVCKKLAFDLLRCTRLTPDLWDTVLSGVRSDLAFPDPDVAAAALSVLSAVPSHLLARLVHDAHREIASCFDSPADSLRLAAADALGCVLARDDIVLLCDASPTLLDRVSAWWRRIATAALDRSDAVSRAAFDSLARLFQEFESKRMSRLAGDKLIDTENSLAIRSNWVVAAVDVIWLQRNALMARALVLPIESFRATVFPLVYAAKTVASGAVDIFRKLSKIAPPPDTSSSAEKLVGISDVVSHLLPFLSSLDPPLVFEVGINMLSLADVPGGKPEWASASIIAILTLWDRQEFSSARESIVRAVVTNLHLLDLSMQVSLFKRLLLMVRNLRAESDRMHALACICRTALCVDLFAKESVRRGQKPLPGTDITSLFEDLRIKDDLNSITSKSLFREELVASLVESCFQLSLPLPEQKNSGTESRVIGALAYGTGYGALNWTESALEVVEVCRPCVLWDCDGRTYAIDCYLKLLVRLCHIYDTRGGVKRIKDGASQDQILNETRLRNLQLQLIKDLREVHTPRIAARLIWAMAEHFDLEGLDPLLADDPEDPLNIIISNMHKVLFITDSSASTTNRLQDVQAVLICAQRLGSRNPRAGQLLSKELEDFRNSNLADSVNKHQCRYILQIIKYVTSHPESSIVRWTGVGEATGDYPFSHHKLTVQYSEASAAQDRKLEGLVHKAIHELWRSDPSELSLLLTKGIDSTYHKVPPKTVTLTGSSDPCYVEAYHLADSTDGRITLHLKILNLTELELNRVDIRVGLSGALYFMDASPQAVRQLRSLVSQDPVHSSVTVGVSHFERCALWVQVIYYPFFGSSGTGEYEGDYAEEDAQIMRQKRTLKPELGEPVILRCQPYKIPLTELLLPHKSSPVEFFRLWPSLPAILEYTGAYTYEGSGFKATAAQQYDSSPFLSGLKSLSSKPFHQVCSHFIRTVAGFQICYAAKTWYGGFLGMMIFGASEVSRNVDLGDETTTMMCKFVVRASDASITKQIESDIQGWLDDITDGGVEYMPEDEVKIAAAERLRISMERIALLKAAKPKPQPPKVEEEKVEEEEEKKKENVDENGQPKEPSTLSTLTAEEAEHRALQAAVLQEWHMLCKEKAIKV